ncbi:MAG: FIST C-terminal domain-containing protein [Burkholderiaceae bacterium]|nr:FIST C-terminal domain-containing protein [Burkholderiaceae bacterium]
MDDRFFRRAHSCALDARQAAQELHAGLQQDELALVVFFCSSEYDLDTLADELNTLFPGVAMVGCTTAGEIGPSGYRTKSLSGTSFSRRAGSAAVGHLDRLQQFDAARGQVFVHDLLQRLEGRAPGASCDNSFAMMLIDGLSVREEPVVRALQKALGKISLFGGSAGDDCKFQRTFVFHDGAFHTDSVALVLFSTHLPFTLFKTQHFARGDERLVVTEADAARRVVREINGLPAAEEYARVIKCPLAELGPARFAASPVVVMVDGADYVRSIQQCNPDGSLTFFCAIEEGVVLRVANGKEMLANLESTFEMLEAELGPLELVLGCDCILRNLEAQERNLIEPLGALMRGHNVVGFSSYGEQYGGVHINQTLTGIAIGRSVEERHE